jgi:hypothetical protein
MINKKTYIYLSISSYTDLILLKSNKTKLRILLINNTTNTYRDSGIRNKKMERKGFEPQ